MLARLFQLKAVAVQHRPEALAMIEQWPNLQERVIRFKARSGSEASLRKWLLEEALPPVPARPGMVGAHLLEGAVAAPMTKEQSICGADAGVYWALFLTGYAEDLAGLRREVLGNALLEQHGGTGISEARYRIDYALSEREAKG